MTVIVIAAALRIAFLVPDEPLLSTDIWRYMHDGRVLLRGENPYARSPDEWWDKEYRDALAAGLVIMHEPAVDRINNSRLVTIYQPTSQWVFAALSPADLWHPGTNQTFRAAFVGFDLLIVAVLLGVLWVQGRSPWWAALYAWHPLAVTEVAWSGHQDVIGIAALLACLVLATRLSDIPAPARGSHLLKDLGMSAGAGVAFALAVGVKPIVLPVAAPLAWRMVAGRRWAGLAAAVLATTATLAALYLPFMLMEGGLDRMWATVRTFTEFWSWNPSLHAVATWALGDKTLADRICGGLLAGVLVIAMFRTRDAITAAMAFLFAALLLSSTAHPWYLLWALALLPLRPGAWFVPALWVYSLTITWGYAAVFDARGFKPPAWVVWAEYVPVYAALLAGPWWRRRWAVTSCGASPPSAGCS